jgi:hypothetical protein
MGAEREHWEGASLSTSHGVDPSSGSTQKRGALAYYAHVARVVRELFAPLPAVQRRAILDPALRIAWKSVQLENRPVLVFLANVHEPALLAEVLLNLPQQQPDGALVDVTENSTAPSLAWEPSTAPYLVWLQKACTQSGWDPELMAALLFEAALLSCVSAQQRRQRFAKLLSDLWGQADFSRCFLSMVCVRCACAAAPSCCCCPPLVVRESATRAASPGTADLVSTV